MYDQYGLDGTRGSNGFGGDDLFEGLFRGGFAGGPFGFSTSARKRKGEDSKIPYEVSLEDLYVGKSVKYVPIRDCAAQRLMHVGTECRWNIRSCAPLALEVEASPTRSRRSAQSATEKESPCNLDPPLAAWASLE